MTDKPKLVRVEWIDAFAGTGWTANFHEPTEVHTVGWLAADELEYIVVCASFDPDTAEYNACMTIPRALVEKLEPLDG